VLAGAVITLACATLLTGLLVANNASYLGVLGAVEIAFAMLLVSFVVNAVFSVVLLLAWPLVARVARRWFAGQWPTFYTSGLLALNLAWILWHRLAMVHQWASVRPFITWAGIGQNLLLIVVVFGIVVGAVVGRTGRTGRLAAGAWLAAALIAGVAAVSWNAHGERAQRRFPVATIRASLSSAGGRSAAPVATTRERVIVLGIDGMCWSVMKPLLEAGHMPQLERAMRGGAIGYLDNDDLSLSPRVWSTILTGRTVSAHGIYDFKQLYLPWSGRTMPDLLIMQPTIDTFYGLGYLLEKLDFIGPWEISWVGSPDRRVAAMWEVASQFEKRVVVANVLVNLPVRPVNGAMIKLDRLPDLDVPTVYPPGLAEVWKPLPLTDTTARTDATYEERARAVEHEANFTIDLFREYDIDLGIYYSNFVDTVTHTNWDFYARDRFLLAETPRSLSDGEWSDLVRDHVEDRVFNVYVRMDTIVGRFLDAFPEATLILVSDHGWTFSGYEHFGSPDGVVVMAGPRIRPGVDLVDAHILDVASTTLALIDVPLSRELEGRVWNEALAAELIPNVIEAYDPPSELSADRYEIQLDEAEIERLKTLGYVE
jgi:hypothetical protein